MARLAVKDLDSDDFAAFGATNTVAGVTDIFGFFTKDGAEQSFLRTELLLALWRNLANEDVASFDFATDRYDTAFVEMTQGFFTDSGRRFV